MAKNSFRQLAEIDPDAALALDFDFFCMAPAPLSSEASEEEREAFEKQLEIAVDICDAKAEEILNNK